jgi:hypothetical protein
MKRLFPILMVLAVVSAASQPCAAQSNDPSIVVKIPSGLPAFPGAEGFGAGATGGRGGRVIYVTNHEPSGPGSYADAIHTPGPRIILFAVSGTIPYPFGWITHGDLTVIGTTAPGEGVEIIGRFPIAASNIIVRGMRFSNRPPLDEDVVQTQDVQRDVIFDHCSFRYGSDELVRFKGNGASLGRVDGLTVQFCILGPGLAGLGSHPWGAELDGVGSIHHNVWYHLLNRVPKTLGGLWDWRSNVIYNCRNGYVHLPDTHFNLIDNYVIDRANSPNPFSFTYHPNLHDSGNVRESGGKAADDDLLQFGPVLGEYVPPWRVAPVTTHKARDLEAMLTPIAGAFLPVRDATDRHFIEGMTARTGKIPYWKGPPGSWRRGKGSPLEFTDVWYERWTDESLPSPASGAKAPPDGDQDGMPDEWEKAHGLNPADATDGPADSDRDGYTNVEEFFNRTDPRQYVDYTAPANNVHTLHPAR